MRWESLQAPLQGGEKRGLGEEPGAGGQLGSATSRTGRCGAGSWELSPCGSQQGRWCEGLAARDAGSLKGTSLDARKGKGRLEAFENWLCHNNI